MASLLERMAYIGQQGEAGRKRGLMSLLGQAYGADPAQRQQVLSTVAQRGGIAEALSTGKALGEADESVHESMAKRAKEVVALYKSSPQMAQQIYQNGLLPLAAQAGIANPPPTLDDSLIPGLEKLASAATGEVVHSQKVGADGFIYNTMRDGSIVNTGVKADRQMWLRDQPGIAPGLVGKDGTITPLSESQPAAQMPSASGVAAFANRLKQAGVSDAEIEALIAQAMSGEVEGSPEGLAAPRPAVAPAEQARLGMEAERVRLAQEAAARAEETSGVPAGYRRTAAGGLEPIPGGPADPNAPRPLSPSQVAAQQKAQRTQRKEQQMLAANDAAVDQTVKLIDDILARKSDLGGVTGLGRVGAMIPGTDWADVAAKLDTLKGRSAFGALQQMRANSPTGGALGQVSERELYLLQNAETQLQDSQSPESLVKALQDYKAALQASKRRMHEGVSEFYSDQPTSAPATGGVDDLLSKYGVK